MKSTRKMEDDTAKEFLRQLAAERGKILTDEDFESIRLTRLEDLARPPRIEWAVSGPGLACILVGIGLVVAALLTRNVSLLLFGPTLVGFGSYLFFGNLRACRTAMRRPCTERLGEIDDLLRSGLITAKEHETIKQAIEHESTVRV